MEKETLQKKVESKLESLEESLKYQLESQCELLSGIKTIQYLIFLLKHEDYL